MSAPRKAYWSHCWGTDASNFAHDVLGPPTCPCQAVVSKTMRKPQYRQSFEMMKASYQVGAHKTSRAISLSSFEHSTCQHASPGSSLAAISLSLVL
ncbi:hypothetical protein OE88DRAFT_500782 [Heliocybe sulcata]|uniref:Uncharacterized protein n=1 Tax=Heliocybe sulcata TaxID=5364 RepID=A0A5C3MVA0_9AGAM|nr:hypothetical protein OE88DRAFT_500782 [Heliocybe sulcata]